MRFDVNHDVEEVGDVRRVALHPQPRALGLDVVRVGVQQGRGRRGRVGAMVARRLGVPLGFVVLEPQHAPRQPRRLVVQGQDRKRRRRLELVEQLVQVHGQPRPVQVGAQPALDELEQEVVRLGCADERLDERPLERLRVDRIDQRVTGKRQLGLRGVEHGRRHVHQQAVNGSSAAVVRRVVQVDEAEALPARPLHLQRRPLYTVVVEVDTLVDGRSTLLERRRQRAVEDVVPRLLVRRVVLGARAGLDAPVQLGERLRRPRPRTPVEVDPLCTLPPVRTRGQRALHGEDRVDEVVRVHHSVRLGDQRHPRVHLFEGGLGVRRGEAVKPDPHAGHPQDRLEDERVRARLAARPAPRLERRHGRARQWGARQRGRANVEAGVAGRRRGVDGRRCAIARRRLRAVVAHAGRVVVSLRVRWPHAGFRQRLLQRTQRAEGLGCGRRPTTWAHARPQESPSHATHRVAHAADVEWLTVLQVEEQRRRLAALGRRCASTCLRR